ncbi:PLP-dependent aminotransferase family protein [Sutcliffiella cohnii]|uniref:MocR-like pyridoxine biosynthesis transcription factor PdxR n=1 Tax=Sutcliffiella cohnii TaxID=33932 RepID=UPI002E208AC3|nr:PLP-dependent aminotransferase family protein [Sutcliffiella cohnii]
MLLFQVDRSGDKTLTQQVYEEIRWRILENVLKENEKIPSSRELANTIGVSRNIVLEAYHQLESEGYIHIKQRSGTFIASGTSISHLRKKDFQDIKHSTPVDKKCSSQKNIIDYKAGNPAMDHFPRKVWGKIVKEVCIDVPDSLFGYQDESGNEELKEELASYLETTRGVVCEPDQIVITSGATQALSLITTILVTEEKDSVILEDPVTDEMRQIFLYNGATIIPADTDEQGIIPANIPQANPSFVFVIPSHQFPLGGTLSIQRRIELINFAEKQNCYIVEDDYDSEFTYEGSPVRSMQGLAPGKVIYVGTFSKILAPALRIGYVVLPHELLYEFKQHKWYTDRHNSSLEQIVLARFMKEGHFLKHIRKMKRIYQRRRTALVNSLEKYFDHFTIIGENTGMHLVVEFPVIQFDKKLLQQLYCEGIKVYPVDEYAINKGNHSNKLLLGYGSLREEEIEEGISILFNVLSRCTHE